MNNEATLLFIVLGLGFLVAGFALWWKLFKKSFQYQKDSLELIDKKLELSIREKGLLGTIKRKKFILYIVTVAAVLVLFELIDGALGI